MNNINDHQEEGFLMFPGTEEEMERYASELAAKQMERQWRREELMWVLRWVLFPVFLALIFGLSLLAAAALDHFL